MEDVDYTRKECNRIAVELSFKYASLFTQGLPLGERNRVQMGKRR